MKEKEVGLNRVLSRYENTLFKVEEENVLFLLPSCLQQIDETTFFISNNMW